MKFLKKLLVLVMSTLLFTSNTFAAVSKSKTATELTEDNISNITLSLPSDEEKLISDVVFVVDTSSCAKEAWDQTTEMMKKLSEDVSKKDGALKIGAVIFRGTAYDYPLTLTGKDSIEKVMDDIKKKGEDTEAYVSLPENKNTLKGSNMHSGLVKANEMLSADKDVPNSRKYVILVSDGITYTWLQDGKQYGVAYANVDSFGFEEMPIYAASNSSLESRTGSLSWHPEDYAAYFEENEKAIEAFMAERGDVYDRSIKTSTKYSVPTDDFDSTDCAMLRAYQEYQKLEKKYHTYAITVPSGQYGEYFMNFLSGNQSNKEVLNDISYDIYYVVSSGSKVKDYMGYGENYNFDLVNKASEIFVKVGNTKYEAKEVEKNVYSFADGKYVVTYYPESENNEHDYLVWEINTNVSNFERVSLLYQVQLMETPIDAGTYTLETNHSAVLTPVDSNNKEGKEEKFEVPTVKLVVEDQMGEDEEPTEEPTEDEPVEEPTEEPVVKEETEDGKKPEVYTGVEKIAKTGTIIAATTGLIGSAAVFILKKRIK